MSERFDVIEAALERLWGVVNDLARLPVPRAPDFRVSIFGSARMKPGDAAYESVKELARELAARGCAIVTGGGPGMMQAANEGEKLGDPTDLRANIGINVELPFEPEPNAFVERAYRHRTFFTRLHHFVRLSHAFVVTRGGIGTALEALMVWQLLQVRHVENVPLIFIGPMWHDLVRWAKQNMLSGDVHTASAPDLEIPICVDTNAEAVAIIEARLTAFRAAAVGT